MEVGDGAQGRDGNRAAKTALRHLAEADSPKWRAVARIERGKVAANPTRGRAAFVVYAALHQLHCSEVTARFVRRAAGVNDGEIPSLPRGHQRLEVWVKAEEAVEINCAQICFGLVVVRARDAEGGALGVVSVVAVRNHDVEAIGGAAQEDDDEGVAARRRVLRGKGESWHPIGPGHSSDKYGGGFEEFAAGDASPRSGAEWGEVGHGRFPKQSNDKRQT
mgnify:CR=1 FL=1